jgi:hypothetical protein
MRPLQEVLLTGLLGVIPELLVLLLAFVFVVIGKHRKPAILVLLAMAVAIALNFGLAFYYDWLFEQRIMIGWSPERERTVMLASSAVQMVIRLIVLALLVIAAFGWRNTRDTSNLSTSSPAPGSSSEGARLTSRPKENTMPDQDAPPFAGTPLMPNKLPPISKGRYLGTIVGSYVVALLLLIPGFVLVTAHHGRNAAVGMPFVCGAELLMILGTVMLAILIYKLWARIQGEPTTRATPGKACGFLFIPIFNFYWFFQAYWGWAKDYNQFIQARGINAPRAPEGLALTLCIFLLLSVIPILGLLFGIVSLILLAIFIGSAIDGANAIVAAE